MSQDVPDAFTRMCRVSAFLRKPIPTSVFTSPSGRPAREPASKPEGRGRGRASPKPVRSKSYRFHLPLGNPIFSPLSLPHPGSWSARTCPPTVTSKLWFLAHPVFPAFALFTDTRMTYSEGRVHCARDQAEPLAWPAGYQLPATSPLPASPPSSRPPDPGLAPLTPASKPTGRFSPPSLSCLSLPLVLLPHSSPQPELGGSSALSLRCAPLPLQAA